MDKPCDNCVCKDSGQCSCEKLDKYELYIEAYNQALEDIFNKCNEKYPKNYANEPELGGAMCVFTLNNIKAFKNELSK